ncbi:MAG: c-type cytochrome domain-containing protein [Pseudomonadota bacterium]|nr:c-type cytochrome domain-containing protein [Pseudomonadota bacterium]
MPFINISSSGKFYYSSFVVLIFALVLSYQNCGEGFQAEKSGSTNQLSGNPPPIATGPKPNATIDEFRACLSVPANTNDPAGLASCLNGRVNSDHYDAAVIGACATDGNTSELLLSACMSKRGNLIINHRPATQLDIDSCRTLVGDLNIATCLEKNGVKNNLSQTDIDICTIAAGPTGVEKCLRAKGLIAKRGVLMQNQAKLCQIIEGNTSNSKLAYCLVNGDLLAPTVVQANIDTCIANTGFDRVVRCLRVNNFVSKAVMQAHLNFCNSAVGSAAIATCLDNNGLLPVVAAEVLGLQTQINTCVTNVTVASLAKCLRAAGVLSTAVLQPHVASCSEVAPLTGLLGCLSANFNALPATLTQVEIDDCILRNNGTLANNVRCLVTKRILPDVPTQASVNACNRFVGPTGLANCHDASGLLLPGIVQQNFDTCVTNVGITNVEACLYNTGAIGSYSRLIGNVAPANLFTVSCSGCHNVNLMRGMMNISVYASVLAKIIPGNPNASLLYQRVTSANNPMPPAGRLPAATTERIRLWILQGARNN